MSVSMRGVVLTGPGQLEVSDRLPRPNQEAGEALVVVRSVGICGTDLTIFAGHHPRVTWPLVPGHEIFGEVAGSTGETANASDRLEAGARVVINPLLTCGRCVPCRAGSSHVCDNLRLVGIDRMGGMAEFVAVQSSRLVPVPPTVPDQLAVLAEPLAVCVRAVRLSSVSVGNTVAVLGAGPIGLLTGLVARHAGATQGVVFDVRRGRMRVAERMGFEAYRLDLARDEPGAEFRRAFDVTYDCTGHPAALSAATALTRTQGRIMAVGVPHERSGVDLREINFRELSIVGSRVYSTTDFDTAVRLLDRLGPPLAQLIGAVFPFSKAAEAYQMAKHESAIVKVALTPREA